jgi:hypothetical protein
MTAAVAAVAFDWHDALARADAILSRPPARTHIERVRPAGGLVCRFALPLDLLRPQNRTRHAQPWMQAKVKKALFLRMLVQLGGLARDVPLRGRPLVRCVRFSSVEPDAYNDGFKAAIDVLCAIPPRTTVAKLAGKRAPKRLNVIADDKPTATRVVQWWEPAPRGKGFGLIEVWTS